MATIQYVSAASEIPETSKYILVELGSDTVFIALPKRR